MKIKSVLAALLLVGWSMFNVQCSMVFAQGFRVYKSDGTVAQFSLRTDSIVFYDGLGTDVDFGPFTPVNQCIVGTWYKTKSETITFSEDGTTDFLAGATYEFLPYQGTIIVNDASGMPMSILKVHKVTSEMLVVSTLGSETFGVWSKTQSGPTPDPGDHEWVDLGLPSGTLWATCNVGASSPEEYGDYFAWGETEPKSTYNWSTYKWMNAGQSIWSQINKYTFADGQTDACWYSDGTFIGDGKTELEAADDAATANWGSGWQMPSIAQLQELYNSSYTTTEWTTQNGVSGRKITSKSNGNSLFLPAAGYRYDTSLYDAGSRGYYWSRSLYTDYSGYAYHLYFDSGLIHWYLSDRDYGLSVRPVRVQE